MIENSVYEPAHKGDIVRVDEWLSGHADEINLPVSDGYTLLHVACAFGHVNLVSYLLGRMALVNVNADNDSKATPLHLAVAFRKEEVAQKIVGLLIEHGAELNAQDANGETPLHHAVARASQRLVALLIEAGADPFLKNRDGRSSMDLAKDLEDPPTIVEALKRAHYLIANAH